MCSVREKRKAKRQPELPKIQGDTEVVRRRRANREILHRSRIAFQEEVRQQQEREEEKKKEKQLEIQKIKAETRVRKEYVVFLGMATQVVSKCMLDMK